MGQWKEKVGCQQLRSLHCFGCCMQPTTQTRLHCETSCFTLAEILAGCLDFNKEQNWFGSWPSTKQVVRPLLIKNKVPRVKLSRVIRYTNSRTTIRSNPFATECPSNYSDSRLRGRFTILVDWTDNSNQLIQLCGLQPVRYQRDSLAQKRYLLHSPLSSNRPYCHWLLLVWIDSRLWLISVHVRWLG